MTGSGYAELRKKCPNDCHRRLFSEYYSYVYTIVFNRLRSCARREDIEECVSDVFSDIFIQLDSENAAKGDLKGFVSVIAGRRAVDMFRRLTSKGSYAVSLDDEGVPEQADDTDIAESAERAETCNALLDAVKALGEPDTTIVFQKYYYNKSSADIAELLDMKPASVRKRLSRAIDKLRRILSENGEGR